MWCDQVHVSLLLFEGPRGFGLWPFDHSNGAGFVAPHQGDYLDAIVNRKAAVHLLVHEARLGGMSPYAARHLRRLGRAAATNGIDGTDYMRSFTARSFVPHFGQRISTACVMYGAEGISQRRPQKEPRPAPPRCGVRVRRRGEGRGRAPSTCDPSEKLRLPPMTRRDRLDGM